MYTSKIFYNRHYSKLEYKKENKNDKTKPGNEKNTNQTNINIKKKTADTKQKTSCQQKGILKKELIKSTNKQKRVTFNKYTDILVIECDGSKNLATNSLQKGLLKTTGDATTINHEDSKQNEKMFKMNKGKIIIKKQQGYKATRSKPIASK